MNTVKQLIKKVPVTKTKRVTFITHQVDVSNEESNNPPKKVLATKSVTFITHPADIDE